MEKCISVFYFSICFFFLYWKLMCVHNLRCVLPKSHTDIVTNELWKEFMAFFYIIVSCILNIDCTCNATTITIRTAAAVVVIVDVHSGNTQTPKHVWFIQQGWNIHIHRWSVLYYIGVVYILSCTCSPIYEWKVRERTELEAMNTRERVIEKKMRENKTNH